jgi:hypothetical protein
VNETLALISVARKRAEGVPVFDSFFKSEAYEFCPGACSSSCYNGETKLRARDRLNRLRGSRPGIVGECFKPLTNEGVAGESAANATFEGAWLFQEWTLFTQKRVSAG